MKVTINENIKFGDYASGIRLPDCTKLTVNWKKWIWRHNFLTWRRRQIFLTLFCFFLSNLVMTISFYNGLTRNPETGNTPVWVLPNIWKLGRVRNTKPGTNVSDKMLVNSAKCQSYSFYRFLSYLGKKMGGGGGGGGGGNYPPPTRLGLNFQSTRVFYRSK